MSHLDAYDKLIRKLKSFAELSKDDEQALATLPFMIREVGADKDVLREHQLSDHCCLLVEGFMFRSKYVPNGARQIMSFHLPGDFIDLQSLHLGVMDHNVGTLVRCQVAFVPQTALLNLMREHPAIASLLWRDSLIDAAIFREWIVNVGRRSAYERIAHL